MNRSPTVIYNKVVFDHLEVCPLSCSTATIAEFDRREQRLGVRFPGALREWYALADAWRDLWWYMGVNWAGDSSFAPSDLGEPDRIALRDDSVRRLDHLAAGFIPFLLEHQDEALWALALDGSEDPPVVIAELPFGRPDPDGEEPGVLIDPASAAEVDWKPHASSFSTFILSRVWWARFADTTHELRAYQDEPLAPGDLHFLRSNFEEGPIVKNWPPSTISYRFGHDDGVINVTTSTTAQPAFGWYHPELVEKASAACCVWTIWGESWVAMERLARQVMSCGQIRERLYGYGDSEEIANRLRLLRSE